MALEEVSDRPYYFSYVSGMRIAAAVGSCIAFGTGSSADIPEYGLGEPTQDKIEYCLMLADKLGYLSEAINEDYFGVGVHAPEPGRWDIRIKEPGWFSDDLFVVLQQTTREKFKDFTHEAYCLWSIDDPWFEFRIEHHVYPAILVCHKYGVAKACP